MSMTSSRILGDRLTAGGRRGIPGQSCADGGENRGERYSTDKPEGALRWQATIRDASRRLRSEQLRSQPQQASPLIEDQALQRSGQIGPDRNQQEDEDEIPANSAVVSKGPRQSGLLKALHKPTEPPRIGGAVPFCQESPPGSKSRAWPRALRSLRRPDPIRDQTERAANQQSASPDG